MNRFLVEDAVHYCPSCGASLDQSLGLVDQFWRGDDTIFCCWCPTCFWGGEITYVRRVMAHELTENGTGEAGR